MGHSPAFMRPKAEIIDAARKIKHTPAGLFERISVRKSIVFSLWAAFIFMLAAGLAGLFEMLNLVYVFLGFSAGVPLLAVVVSCVSIIAGGKRRRRRMLRLRVSNALYDAV